MIEFIQHVDERFEKARVHKFREKFMSACDGHATDRILAQFFGESLEKYRRAAVLPASEVARHIEEKTRAALPEKGTQPA